MFGIYLYGKMKLDNVKNSPKSLIYIKKVQAILYDNMDQVSE